MESPESTEYRAGPERLAPRIVAVAAEADTHRIAVDFETGEQRRYDVSPLLSRGVFRRIAEPKAFYRVSVVEGGGGVEWEAGPDLSRNSVYYDGEPVEQG